MDFIRILSIQTVAETYGMYGGVLIKDTKLVVCERFENYKVKK